MSPEQAAADPRVDNRADIYAVGAMAYEMLCGRTPFVAPTPQGMLAAHIAERPGAPARYRNTIPPAMNELVLRCLEKNPADRIQTADEIAARLAAMATPTGGTTPISTTPISTARLDAEAAVRRSAPGRVLGLFALASVAVVGAAFALTRVFDLPDWMWQGAAVAMALGLPVIAYTGRVERKRAVAMTMGSLRFEPEPAHHDWFTWRRSLVGGGLALGLVALLAGGYLVSRKLGIGPGSTLMSAGVLAAQDRIILVEFENRTSDSTLGASVTEALRIDLGQSNVMRLMEATDQQAALQRMGRPAETKVDQAIATDLARREGIKAIITGEITSLGSGYSLAARVINAYTGETLMPIRETASDASQLIGAVDKLSKALREKVGESLGRIRGGDPLEQVTTSSLEALRLYTEAVRDHAAGRSEEAVKLLRQAVAVDSTFAMAWRKLAVVVPQAVIGGDPEGMDAARRAYQFRDRLPPVERGLTEAYYYSIVTGDQDKEEAAYRAVLAENPDEPAALNNLGLLLTSQGRTAEAEPLLRHLVATSQLQSGYINLNGALILEGKTGCRGLGAERVPTPLARVHALRRHDQVRSLQPSGLPRRRLPHSGSQAQGARRPVTAGESPVRADRRRGGPGACRGIGTVVRPAGADDGGRRGPRRGVLPPDGAGAGQALFPRGQQAVARANDSLMPKPVFDSISPDQRPFMGVAYGYAVAGRADRVHQLHDEWVRVRPADQRTPADSVYWIAMIAQAEGRWREAAVAYRCASGNDQVPDLRPHRRGPRLGARGGARFRPGALRGVGHPARQSTRRDRGAVDPGPDLQAAGRDVRGQGGPRQGIGVLRELRHALAGRRPGAAAAGEGSTGADGGVGGGEVGGGRGKRGSLRGFNKRAVAVMSHRPFAPLAALLPRFPAEVALLPSHQILLEPLARPRLRSDPRLEERVGKVLACDGALHLAGDADLRAGSRHVGEDKLLLVLDVFHVPAERGEVRLELRGGVGRVVLKRFIPGVAHLLLVDVAHELHDQSARAVGGEDCVGIGGLGGEVQPGHVHLENRLLA